jgi:hypothetical protein
MANIFVRSPFYVSKKDLGGTAAYGILTIQVDGTTVADSDIRIPVDRNNTTSVAFLYQNNIVYSRLIASSASYVFEYVSNGVNAYDSFKDRVVQSGGSYEPNECIIDFLDEYEIFEVDQINIATTDGLRIVKVKTIEECKYKPAKISFINKFGGLQDLWFFRKSIKQLSVTKEEYKRFEISINGLYDTLKHPRKTFNIQGAKSITLNTGYVDESYNEVIEQMMQSEYVWMEQDTVVTPQIMFISIQEQHTITVLSGTN